jgi:lysozyme
MTNGGLLALAAGLGALAASAAALSRQASELAQQGGQELAGPPEPEAPAELSPDQQERNLRAFLHMIRVAEGTAGPDGYRALFGHTPARPRLFAGWSDHPRQAVQFTDQRGRRLWTSAAGAFQFMARSPIPGGGWTTVDTWDRVRQKLALPDFSPTSQDRAALELIREAGALDDVMQGRFGQAVHKVRRTWASLPGAGYGQPERTMDTVTAAYVAAGGVMA